MRQLETTTGGVPWANAARCSCSQLLKSPHRIPPPHRPRTRHRASRVSRHRMPSPACMRQSIHFLVSNSVLGYPRVFEFWFCSEFYISSEFWFFFLCFVFVMERKKNFRNKNIKRWRWQYILWRKQHVITGIEEGETKTIIMMKLIILTRIMIEFQPKNENKNFDEYNKYQEEKNIWKDEDNITAK